MNGFHAAAAAVGIFVLSAASSVADAQTAQWACRVSFLDKAGSPTVADAATYLSPRSLARRALRGAPVVEEDRPVGLAYLDTVLSVTSGLLHCTSRWLNTAVILVEDSADIAPLRSIPWVTSLDFVAYYPAGLHGRAARPLEASVPPAALSSAKATGSAGYYGATWTQTALVHGDAVHDLGYEGARMLIAVLDEGFDGVLTHPAYASLRVEGRLLEQYDFVEKDSSAFAGGTHGTRVLSNAAGKAPGAYVGAAPGAQYALYRTEDAGSEQAIEMDNLVAGAERADSLGADILNISLGYNEFFGPAAASLPFSALDGHTTPAARGINAAARAGMLPVVSAGNEGGNGWHRILTPGDADSALTVGGVDASINSTPSSGYGPNAAGVIKPDVATLGLAAAVIVPAGGYTVETGTSHATPQIAGWAACLWQSRPSLRPGEIKDLIIRSAHLYPAADSQKGYGVPNFGRAFGPQAISNTTISSARLSVFPNPFGEEFSVEGGSDVSNATLSDVAGRIVWSDGRVVSGATKLRVRPGADLQPGLYLLRVTTADGPRVVRVVKY